MARVRKVKIVAQSSMHLSNIVISAVAVVFPLKNTIAQRKYTYLLESTFYRAETSLPLKIASNEVVDHD